VGLVERPVELLQDLPKLLETMLRRRHRRTPATLLE